MPRTLRTLTQLMGWACVLIGLYHVLLGNAAIPGAGSAGTTIDSWGRFMGASFVGYGLAWLWAAQQRPIPARAVRWLAGVFLLGGAGRLLSLAENGWPQWFQSALTVIELGLPPVFFWLADAEERAARTGVPAAGPRGIVGHPGADGGLPGDGGEGGRPGIGKGGLPGTGEGGLPGVSAGQDPTSGGRTAAPSPPR